MPRELSRGSCGLSQIFVEACHLSHTIRSRLALPEHDNKRLSNQLLLSDFTMDSLEVTPRQTTYVPGVDYMTDYDNWLHIQVNFPLW